MIRDITIGQYYPSDSVIHRLDPRVKLFATMIYMITLFLYKGLAELGLITLFLFGVIQLSKVPLGYMFKGLRAIMVLLLFTSFFNLTMTPGAVTYWHFGIFQVTDTDRKSVV